MKIKEAAAYCGLTEKAIRLYEAKGLIHPKTEEKNGRTFREYDEETVRTLLTVGTLRRADFSMEQIGLMQSSPERIPEIFDAYREEVKGNARRLAVLSRVMEGMDLHGEVTLAEFADRLAIAMMPEDIAPQLSGEASETEQPPVIRFHHYVWDEEGTPEEKEDAYRRFLEKQARRERLEDVLFAVPRKIGAGWCWLAEKVNGKIRGEDNKVKKTVKLSVVFLLICCLLLGGWRGAVRRMERASYGCTTEIFFAMHDVIYTLRHTVRTGEYTYGHSEVVTKNLTTIENEAAVAELLRGTKGKGTYRSWWGFSDLTNAMGCTYSAEINGVRVQGILYDGTVSEEELAFLCAVLADLEKLYAPMLAEDGLNRRGDLRYEQIRGGLWRFMQKWGEWETGDGATYGMMKEDNR